MDYTEENRELVARVKELCKHHHISLTILEEMLGFANGSIGKWAKSTRQPNLNRLVMVANYFGVTVDYLRYGAKENAATLSDDGKQLAARLFALSDEDFALVAQTVAQLRDNPKAMRSALRLALEAVQSTGQVR